MNKSQIEKMSTEQVIQFYVKKSTAIRQLNILGFSRSEIAKILNIRYQHVRNTLTQELKTDLLKSEIEEIESKISDQDQHELPL